MKPLTSKSHDGLSFLSVISVAFFSSEMTGKDLGRSPCSSLQFKLRKFSRDQVRISQINNGPNTNLVHGAGSLSHLTNRYLQTLNPYMRETKSVYLLAKTNQMSNSKKQDSTFYLNTHFSPTFFNSIDSIIPHPFFRGI